MRWNRCGVELKGRDDALVEIIDMRTWVQVMNAIWLKKGRGVVAGRRKRNNGYYYYYYSYYYDYYYDGVLGIFEMWGEERGRERVCACVRVCVCECREVGRSGVKGN